MHRTIEVLMAEHRIIESVLDSLAARAESAREGVDIDRRSIRSFAEFFVEFADRCHHGKEEDLLFVALHRHGMSRDSGPVAVMFAEHEAGRGHVRTIAEIGRGRGPLSKVERERFASQAHAFAVLLGNHIAKEDHVLYPMALRLIPQEALDEMAETFERFERDGAERRERLLALARELTTEPRRTSRDESNAMLEG